MLSGRVSTYIRLPSSYLPKMVTIAIIKQPSEMYGLNRSPITANLPIRPIKRCNKS